MYKLWWRSDEEHCKSDITEGQGNDGKHLGGIFRYFPIAVSNRSTDRAFDESTQEHKDDMTPIYSANSIHCSEADVNIRDVAGTKGQGTIGKHTSSFFGSTNDDTQQPIVYDSVENIYKCNNSSELITCANLTSRLTGNTYSNDLDDNYITLLLEQHPAHDQRELYAQSCNSVGLVCERRRCMSEDCTYQRSNSSTKGQGTKIASGMSAPRCFVLDTCDSCLKSRMGQMHSTTTKQNTMNKYDYSTSSYISEYDNDTHNNDNISQAGDAKEDCTYRRSNTSAKGQGTELASEIGLHESLGIVTIQEFASISTCIYHTSSYISDYDEEVPHNNDNTSQTNNAKESNSYDHNTDRCDSFLYILFCINIVVAWWGTMNSNGNEFENMWRNYTVAWPANITRQSLH